jgi:hypothetical protein
MKKLSLAAICAVVLVFMLGLSAPVQAEPFIEVVPLDHDFGDVQVGSSSTAIITISNINGQTLEIYSVSLSGSGDFAISMEPDPIVVSGMSTAVEITFAPSAVGYVSAILDIESNDQANPIVSVSLSGVGVAAEPPPSPSIDDILAFFDASVEDGTLYGSGRLSGVAEWRLNRLRNMIVRAGVFIDNGWIELACWQLRRAYRRCDGLPRPPEFVAGPATSTLAQMIFDLMAGLGCGQSRNLAIVVSTLVVVS